MWNEGDEHITRTWTNQYRMMDKHHNFGMIFNSRDKYSITWVFMVNQSRKGGDGQEDNVATPENHQRGGDV
jgi:hypothetical protein